MLDSTHLGDEIGVGDDIGVGVSASENKLDSLGLCLDERDQIAG